MDKRLEERLIAETQIKDVPENFQAIAQLIGIDNMIKLARYCQGAEIYFPKPETIYRQVRNRHIKDEYNGYNEKELAIRYDVTIEQIKRILRGYNPQQMSFDDL